MRLNAECLAAAAEVQIYRAIILIRLHFPGNRGLTRSSFTGES